MNKKFQKSQIMMVSLLVSLLIITPLFLSSSLRPTYIYFVINILIIALGLEAGLLSAALSKPPPEDNKAPQEATSETRVSSVSASPPQNNESKMAKAFEKSASEKLPKPSNNKVVRVKKCPSTPSLFFIGSGETEASADDQAFGEELFEEEEEEEEEDVKEGLSGQELFTRAEMFIGNFHNQLKMQREESWKRIHGFLLDFSAC